MISDPIADLLVRIKNGYLARLRRVSLPYSKMGESLGKILVAGGFLAALKVGKTAAQKTLEADLAYQGKTPALTGVKRVSKPGLRIYVEAKNIPKVLKGLGMTIISTPQGLMTHRQAQKRVLGGELICQVW